MISEEFSQLESALRDTGESGRQLRFQLLKHFSDLVQLLSCSLASEVPPSPSEEAKPEAPTRIGSPQSVASTEAVLSGYGDAEGLRQVLSEAVEVFDGRVFDAEDYVAVWIDAIQVWRRTFVLCMGVTSDGHKRMLGFAEASLNDPKASGLLLGDLVDRGLNAERGLLGITSGITQLSQTLADCFGPQLRHQYCQMRKCKRVVSCLEEQHGRRVQGAITRAFACPDVGEAHAALMRIHDDVKPHNRTAAQWLKRNLEQCLTLHRTGMYDRLSPSLRGTQCIAYIAHRLHRRLRPLRCWMPAQQRRAYLALLLLEMESRMRRLPHATQLAPMQSALFANDNGTETGGDHKSAVHRR